MKVIILFAVLVVLVAVHSSAGNPVSEAKRQPVENTSETKILAKRSLNGILNLNLILKLNIF